MANTRYRLCEPLRSNPVTLRTLDCFAVARTDPTLYHNTLYLNGIFINPVPLLDKKTIKSYQQNNGTQSWNDPCSKGCKTLDT